MIFKLLNGKEYKIIDTKKPYQDGEYPSGGYEIFLKQENGEFVYIDNSPNIVTVNEFLKMVSKSSSGK
jgi:hypothetical protein